MRCLLFFALLLTLGGCSSSHAAELTVYPALAADRLIGTAGVRGGSATIELGIKKQIPKGPLILNTADTYGKSFGHKIMVTDLTQDVVSPGVNLDEIDVDVFLAKSSLGHLIVVPDTSADLSKSGQALLDQLEGKIIHDRIDNLAVYFVKKSGRSVEGALLNQLVGGDAFDEFVATFSEKEAKALDKPEIASPLATRIRIPKEKDSSASSNTIVVTTSPDTMGAAPGLASGSTSALAVQMELIRLFNNLYSNAANKETMKGLNLIFLTGKQGRLSYPGTGEWLEVQDNSLLDSLDFALCLDDLIEGGSKNNDDGVELFIHTTKTGAKDEQLKATFDSLTTSIGSGSGGKAQLVSKKINASHHEMRWEHEVFSYRDVNSATVSGRKTARPQLARNSIVANVVSVEQVDRLAQITANLANWLLARNEKSAAVSVKKSDVDVAHLESWLHAAASTARPIHALSPNVALTGLKDSASADFLGTGLKEAVQKMTVDKSVVSIVTNTKKGGSKAKNQQSSKNTLPIVFYGPAAVQMEIHVAKTTAFEGAVLGASIGALFFIATFMFGPTRAISIFTTGSAGKKE